MNRGKLLLYLAFLFTWAVFGGWFFVYHLPHMREVKSNMLVQETAIDNYKQALKNRKQTLEEIVK